MQMLLGLALKSGAFCNLQTASTRTPLMLLSPCLHVQASGMMTQHLRRSGSLPRNLASRMQLLTPKWCACIARQAWKPGCTFAGCQDAAAQSRKLRPFPENALKALGGSLGSSSGVGAGGAGCAAPPAFCCCSARCLSSKRLPVVGKTTFPAGLFGAPFAAGSPAQQMQGCFKWSRPCNEWLAPKCSQILRILWLRNPASRPRLADVSRRITFTIQTLSHARAGDALPAMRQLTIVRTCFAQQKASRLGRHPRKLVVLRAQLHCC